MTVGVPDEAFARRLREAAGAIAWSPTGTRRSRGGPTVRRARLRDEEATVAIEERKSGVTVEVTAGPVGAVVLLLEADRRGPPASLGSRNGRRGTAFADGSIVAGWGRAAVVADARPTVRDLVELARYALP